MINAELNSTDFYVEKKFSEEQWMELVDRLTEVFHIAPERKQRILQNRVMKLTAAIPFVAGCSHPARTALSHLSIYLLAASQGGKDLFEHSFPDNDDLFTRLERISHFHSGNEVLIKRGMNMLALAMLEDHKTDAEEDKHNRKYNPLNSGVWDYEVLTAQLRKEISIVPSKELDAVMEINTDLPGYWET